MEGFDEDYLRILELIDNLSSSVLEDDEMLKSREDILQKLAQLNSKVECVAVEVGAGDPAVSTSLEEIEFARQKIELGYRRFRNAQVVASHARSEQWLKRREKLLRPAAHGPTTISEVEQPRKELLNDFNPAVSKSEDITTTLRRVHQMAQGEVLKAELNIEELDSSTKALKDLENKYSAVDVLLNGSRRLVQVLEEADKGDRRRIRLSLGFLAAVLGWIVYRRVLKLPLKILFWNIVNLTRLGKWATGLARKTGMGKEQLLAFETALDNKEHNVLDIDPDSIDLAFGRDPLTTLTDPVETAEAEAHVHTEISELPVELELNEFELPDDDISTPGEIPATEPEVETEEVPPVHTTALDDNLLLEREYPEFQAEPEADPEAEPIESLVTEFESESVEFERTVEPEPEASSQLESIDAEIVFETEPVLHDVLHNAETEDLEDSAQPPATEPEKDQDELYSMETHYYAYEQVVPEETIMPTTGTIYCAPEDTLIKKEL